jgi:hypothetical protein
LLEVSFKELFIGIAKYRQGVHPERKRVRRQIALQEDELKEKVLVAIDELKGQGKPVTQRAISRLRQGSKSGV